MAYAARHGVKPVPREIAVSRQLIEAQLRAYISRNTKLESNGFYDNIYKIDNAVLRSLEVLNAEDEKQEAK